MARIIDQVVEYGTMEESDGLDVEECIIEVCGTYGKMGQLMGELLEYFGGKYDDDAMKVLAGMMVEYIADAM